MTADDLRRAITRIAHEIIEHNHGLARVALVGLQTGGVGMRHLLSIADLGADGIEEVLRITDSFVEVSGRAIPKVPTLRGKTVVSLFYEESTRTRLSFETAAKRLSADTMNFSVGTSSVKKGESLRDTVMTIEAMGIDAVVVRHGSAGLPWQVASLVEAAVLNAC